MSKKNVYKCTACGKRVRTNKKTMNVYGLQHQGCSKLGARRLKLVRSKS